MVFAQSSIKKEDRTGVTVTNTGARTNDLREVAERMDRYWDGTNTSMTRPYFFAGPWVLVASPDPTEPDFPPKRKGPKDSTHVPFYKGLRRYQKRR